MPLSKALAKLKPCLLKERWFYNTVWWFRGSYFRNFKCHFSSGKQQRTFGQGVALASCSCWALKPACCSHRPGSDMQQSSALLYFLLSVCSVVQSGLSCKWIHMSHHSNELHEKRPAFIVDGISTDFEQRHTRALHGHVFQRESLNRRRRNFADKMNNSKANFAKLPRSISIGSPKYI